jgi:hypothetical protein
MIGIASAAQSFRLNGIHPSKGPLLREEPATFNVRKALDEFATGIP